MSEKTKDSAMAAATAVSMGAIGGAIAKHPITTRGRGSFAVNLGSTMGAAAANGAGVGGSLAAGAGLVAAKVAAVATIGVAAAPWILGAGAVYGLYRLVKSK